MTISFERLATVTASTKRSSASAGKYSAPAEYLPTLACTPLDPVSSETRERLQLETPHKLLQTFVDSALDIEEGDVLVVDGTEYPIRSVDTWDDYNGGTYLHLVLERLKR